MRTALKRRSQTLMADTKAKQNRALRNETEQPIFRLVLVCMKKRKKVQQYLNNSGRSLAYLTRGISDYHNGKIRREV